MSEIRHNRLTGEWVIIAPERARRGSSFGRPTNAAGVAEYSLTCPFCPGNETLTDGEGYRAEGSDGQWLVRSVRNRYSVLASSAEAGSAEAVGLSQHTVNCVGLHEVLVETPRHNVPLALVTVEHVQRVLEAYHHRFRAFYADPCVRHVIIFKNHGAEAGASQQHPHSQIVGLPIVPGQVVERVSHAQWFYADTGRCLTCTLMAEEQEHGARIVAENAHFIAFIPYAALSPYHLWIFPKVHAACFSELSPDGLRHLAEIVRTVLAKVHGLLSNPSFNLVIRSLGPVDKDAAHFHWYISIVPRVNKAAGFELGTGMYINPSLPDLCAQALREHAIS